MEVIEPVGVVDRFMQAYYKRFINGEIVFMHIKQDNMAPTRFEVECLVDETKPANTLNTVITIHTVYVDGNYHTDIRIGGFDGTYRVNIEVGMIWIQPQETIHEAMDTISKIRDIMRNGQNFTTAISDYRISA